jgi:hypothetical protein
VFAASFTLITYADDISALDIAILLYFTLISTTASIAQQIHDMVWWVDIQTQEFERKTTFLDNPELAIANGSYGVDLVLYYIRRSSRAAFEIRAH